MKCTIPEISWHNRDPVLTVDIQNGCFKTTSGETYWRVATGGNDSHVLIWHLFTNDNGVASVTCVGDLEHHQKAVNVVRFSPCGVFLASGDDDSIIILWKRREEFEAPLFPEENLNTEQWQSHKFLRGHVEDVYDLCWSPDSSSLVSGSVDNSIILWNVKKGKKICILSDYKGFVQGVTWDPNNQYICSISSDRHCRLIDISTKKTIQKVSKTKIPTPDNHPLAGKCVRLFYDDTFKSFFRRLTFTPDGSLIIVPSGIIESDEKSSNATMVFTRHNIKEPVMVLPSLDENTIAVRCCPTLLKLRENGPAPVVPLPYRILFAVATHKSILLYDTQQITPIAMVSNIHYTRLTDVTWSSCGRILMVSSTDGYCSIIHFDKNELGEVYEESKKIISQTEKVSKEAETSEENIMKIFIEPDNDAMDVDIVEFKSKDVDITVGSTTDTKNETKCETVLNKDHKSNDESEVESDIQLVLEDSNIEQKKSNTGNTPHKIELPVRNINKTPRRVKLITLSSPKHVRKN